MLPAFCCRRRAGAPGASLAVPLLAASPAHYLVVGNPGVGKSTILNGLLGKIVFKSGVSFGTGLTSQLQTYRDSATGCTFADTPGLADTEKRAQAAAAITEALKVGGLFRIFFVLTLSQGRLKPEDLETLKLILEAAPITSYGVIINQASPAEYAALTAGPGAGHLGAVLRELTGKLRADQQAPQVHVVRRDAELDGAEDVAKPLPPDLVQFIASLPGTPIESHAVREVRRQREEEERLAEQRRREQELAAEQERMRAEAERVAQQIERERLAAELRAQALRAAEARAREQEARHERERERMWRAEEARWQAQVAREREMERIRMREMEEEYRRARERKSDGCAIL